ncbi:MAG TPA: hypothetical protein ENI91_04535 [Sphingomonadales bacterium]|nr:hypothetical protein [Sphingomonadales bacterium]
MSEQKKPENVTKSIKIKEPPVLFKETQTLIKQLEKKFNAPVFCYWNNSRGGVCSNDVIALFDALEQIEHQKTIYIFIKSDGGNGEASLRFVNLLRQHCDELIALIPLECSSAATMIALGANEIQMGPMAFLSAIDTSLTHDLSPIDRDNDRVSVSLDELNRVVKLWQNENKENSNPYQHLFQHVHPLVIGAVDRAESLSKMLCEEILSFHMHDTEKISYISDTLNSKYPAHGYPILLNEAKKIGLNVKSMDHQAHQILLDLNNFYSEMGQKATTDFNEIKAHGNEILNILETTNKQLYYQQDKDWFYRSEERRWITMNDNSSWRKNESIDGQIKSSILHIA